jgi:hypothetical protein
VKTIYKDPGRSANRKNLHATERILSGSANVSIITDIGDAVCVNICEAVDELHDDLIEI